MPTPRRRRKDHEQVNDAPGRSAVVLRDEEIARRAYELYEARGRRDGCDWDDWFQAERELSAANAGAADVAA